MPELKQEQEPIPTDEELTAEKKGKSLFIQARSIYLIQIMSDALEEQEERLAYCRLVGRNIYQSGVCR